MPLDLDALQSRLGYQFRNPELLLCALTHPSCETEEIDSNKRLEFLGDKILGAIVASEIYAQHPHHDEGGLTKMCADILSNTSLAARAKEMRLDTYLRTLAQPDIRVLDSAMADSFEALIAAIYLDGGFEAAKAIVLKELHSDFVAAERSIANRNPKGQLQEFLQAASRPTPVYVDISHSGAVHERTFICAVTCNGVELARGSGRTKKAAETEAASKALASLKAP